MKNSQNVIQIDPIEDPRWDSFVENHPFGGLCHLSGWKKVLEKSYKHMKGYYFVLFDDVGQNIKAALPIFEVNSWLTGNRLVSIPFATLCDPLVSTNDDMNKLLEEVLHYFNGQKRSYLEIKTHLSSSLIRNDQLGCITYYKHHYLPLESEPVELRKKFHRSCIRQRISRAFKSDLKFEIGKEELDLWDFYRLHLITRKRLGIPIKPYTFFLSLWNTFSPSGNIQLFFAVKDQKRIASLILFSFKNRVSAEFAVSDERYKDLSANHFLFWEAIKLAYDKGYTVFDFGRTSPSNSGLMAFKSRWGTKISNLPYYYFPHQVAEKRSQLEDSKKYHVVKKICTIAPDCVQEMLGNFFYRHLG